MNNHNITLHKSELKDLYSFFQFQLDEEANRLAAFTAKDMDNEEIYINKYSKFLDDPTINMCTIKAAGEIVGSISKFVMFGDAEITYWIDKKSWGKGIATIALKEFLKIENTRPIHGRVAYDNFGSQKVLQNCGFLKIGSDKGFALARNQEIEEIIFRLD